MPTLDARPNKWPRTSCPPDTIRAPSGASLESRRQHQLRTPRPPGSRRRAKIFPLPPPPLNRTLARLPSLNNRTGHPTSNRTFGQPHQPPQPASRLQWRCHARPWPPTLPRRTDQLPSLRSPRPGSPTLSPSSGQPHQLHRPVSQLRRPRRTQLQPPPLPRAMAPLSSLCSLSTGSPTPRRNLGLPPMLVSSRLWPYRARRTQPSLLMTFLLPCVPLCPFPLPPLPCLRPWGVSWSKGVSNRGRRRVAAPPVTTPLLGRDRRRLGVLVSPVGRLALSLTAGWGSRRELSSP